MGSALKRHGLALGVLTVVTVAMHLPLLRAPGAALLPHADLWMWPMFSLEWGLWGQPGFYPQGVTYGGFAPLTALRALLVAALRSAGAGPDSYWIWAQLAVSFLVGPLLFTAGVYALVTRLVGRGAALVTGFLAAAGLAFPLMTLGGLDIYTHSILFALFALALRGRDENPLAQWSWRRLALSGVALGYSGYVLKSGLLVAPALLLPTPWVAAVAARLRHPLGRHEHGLRSIAIAALLLAAYIGVNGRVLGTVGGRPLIMDGWPNVQIALISLAVIAVRALWRRVTPRELRALAVFTAGAALGFLPEILGSLARTGKATASFGGGGPVGIHQFWRALRELWMGQDHLQFYNGDGRYALAALGLGGAALLLWRLPRRRELWPAVILGAINVFAYFRIAMTSPGASRYLHLLYPLYFLGVALLWQAAWQWRGRKSDHKKRVAVTVFLVTLTVAAQFLMGQRLAWRDHAGSAEAMAKARAAVREAQRQGFTYVWAPSHWEATPLTVLAHGRPTFVQPDEIRSPFVSDDAVVAAPTVGAYFPASYGPPPAALKAYGRHWIVGAATAVPGGAIAEIKPRP